MSKTGEQSGDGANRDDRPTPQFACGQGDVSAKERSQPLRHKADRYTPIARDRMEGIGALLDANDRASKERAVLQVTSLIHEEILHSMADIFETREQMWQHLEQIRVLNRITRGWLFSIYRSTRNSPRRDLSPP